MNYTWISVRDSLPKIETPVLIVKNGVIHIGELLLESPSYEDCYDAFLYWDDPIDDGQIWEYLDITHWMPLPELPNIEIEL